MKLFTSVLLLFTCVVSYGQKTKHIRYATYVEGGGAGDIYSLNFEYAFHSNQSIRVGASWYPANGKLDGVSERSFINIPLTYQYLIGKKHHKLECMTGFLNTYMVYDEFPNQLKINTLAGASYRFQKDSGGVFVRSGIHLFIPLFAMIDRYDAFFYTGKSWRLWPGLAVGYAF